MVKRPGGSVQGLHVPQHPPPEAQEEEEVDQYSRHLEARQESHRSRQQGEEDKGRPGDRKITPREGQEPEDRPVPRARTDGNLPRASLVHFLNYLTKNGQEEEAWVALHAGSSQSSGDKLMEYSRA